MVAGSQNRSDPFSISYFPFSMRRANISGRILIDIYLDETWTKINKNPDKQNVQSQI